jgi:hypothetical protein
MHLVIPCVVYPMESTQTIPLLCFANTVCCYFLTRYCFYYIHSTALHTYCFRYCILILPLYTRFHRSRFIRGDSTFIASLPWPTKTAPHGSGSQSNPRVFSRRTTPIATWENGPCGFAETSTGPRPRSCQSFQSGKVRLSRQLFRS